MKILLIGKDGKLGWELHRSLMCFPHIDATGRTELDLVNHDALRDLVRRSRPDLIINAAAYTDVDRAESEPDLAHDLNVAVPEILATEANGLGALLLHFSTDYVFDGSTTRAYREGDDANPINIYGQSKLQGELAIQASTDRFITMRTSWIYSLRRHCFLTAILERLTHPSTLRVVDDQVSGPTWCRSLAEAVSRVVVMSEMHGMEWLAERSGTYHLAGSGYTSRLEWARAILESDQRRAEHAVPKLMPVKSSELRSAARRPVFSALDCSLFERTFGFQLPSWSISLGLALEGSADPIEF